MAWEAQIRNEGEARCYRLWQDGNPLTFGELFELLGHNSEFADWYTQTLLDCGLLAFFWEHPPLSESSMDQQAEFVLIPAPSLAGLQADPAPFAQQFARQKRKDIVKFENLGGDALLLVPSPVAPDKAYPHLAAFLRHAPASQVRALWRDTATAVRDVLGDMPRWLSTSGLGVAWLHLRLDATPKYYQHTPYRTT